MNGVTRTHLVDARSSIRSTRTRHTHRGYLLLPRLREAEVRLLPRTDPADRLARELEA